MARALGRRGGNARSRRLSSGEKTRIASMGAQARVRSLKVAGWIEENFRYAEAVTALSRQRTRITRLRAFNERLPGVYRNQP